MVEPVKRLRLEELKEKCREVFYNQLVSAGHITKCMSCKNKGTKEGQTLADLIHEVYLHEVELTDKKLALYDEQLANKEVVQFREDLIKQQGILIHYKEALLNSSMKYQKEEYAKNSSVLFSRTQLRIPLDKHINSYYDNYILEVVYYDNVSTLKGKYEEYRALKTKEEKLAFVKANTEITHVGLCIINSNGNHSTTIVLEGECKEKPKEKNVYAEVNGIYCLPAQFADFTKLTLADTLKIDWNNDLQQDFQSKIDLDKENLEIKADKYIWEDNYKILKYKNKNGKGCFFIRYVCPSTGRVYFNSLNLDNLKKVSSFYKERDYESYIDAWWNVTHVGADPYQDVATRC